MRFERPGFYASYFCIIGDGICRKAKTSYMVIGRESHIGEGNEIALVTTVTARDDTTG